MPIIKKNEPLGKRPVVIVYYGEPGICKTSLFNTSDTPLLIDFDRGVERSILRPDTLKVNKWEDVLAEEKEGTFKNYKTIGIDTAKAALDDFLMSYAVESDYKLKKSKLQAYGAIGDWFKLFVNNRRIENADIVIIAHAKKDEDTKKIIPDVTGQSFGLLLRIADQVGYISMINGKRTVQFEPTDTTVGKNVACLPSIEIPDKGSPEFKTFNAMIINRVKDSLDAMNEAQREALIQSEAYQKEIEGCNDPEEMTNLLARVSELPDYLKLPLRSVIIKITKDKGWVVNKDTKKFEVPAAEPKKEVEHA